MHDLTNMLWIELCKARRSRMPLFTLFGSLILPLVGAFLMFIYKYPEVARSIGLISTKANLIGGTADWPTYLSVFTQGIALGGVALFSLIQSWIFGREFVDGTLKDLLAVPVSRAMILLAKFLVALLWFLAIVAIIYGVGLLLGVVLGLPQGTQEIIWGGTRTLAITACLVMIGVLPIAFFASVGRGYLLPIGIVLLGVILTNVMVIAGWGPYFPWSVTALYAGFTKADLEPISYAIVIFTGLAGILSTYLSWKYVDQNR